MFKKLRKFNAISVPSVNTYLVATLLVFIAFLFVTFWSWNNAKQSLDKEIQTSLDTSTGAARDLIKTTVGTYSEVLKSTAGIFSVDPNITDVQWRTYVKSLDISKSYPGMKSMAYSHYIPGNQLDEYLATNTQANGQPYNFRPAPNPPRKEYLISKFIEPYNDRSKVAIGFDPFSEPIRQKAFIEARDTGATAVTGRLVLVQDTSEPSFILIHPVYRNDAPTSNPEQRRAALVGYVSAGVTIKNLLDGLFSKAITKDSALQVYDGREKNQDTLVYQSSTYEKLINQSDIQTSTKALDLGSNTWTIVSYVNQKFVSETQRKLPQTILLGGLILSVLISLLLFFVMVNRARSITNDKNREVQDVKDNLISLASHQLRTPATGVKQFLSMVLEGYAGDINDDQRSMLEKAFVSNERQLDIINQILHVTRADSGRLVLTNEKVDINEIVKTVIGDLHQSTTARIQKVIFKPSAKHIYVIGDRQYLSMAIDNLLSNASKYSLPKKRITITVRQTQHSITLTVLDNGVGIDEKDMHLLFQKFSRIHNDLSVEAGGNGIGLYLCKEIVELHGGTIKVESQPNVGSSFIVTLPRNRHTEN